MSAIRKLSVIYLLCATAFSVAFAFDRHPALEQASRQTVAAGIEGIRSYIVQPAQSVARESGEAVVAVVTGILNPSVAQAPIKARVAAAPPRAVVVPPKPAAIAPLQVHVAAPAPKFVTITPARQLKPELALVPPPPPPSSANTAVSPAELVRVTMRLKENLTHEMLDNFSLFLYVSKADNGPLAQHMYVFAKDASGNLSMLYNWPASTGRELVEMAPNGTRQPSYTPQGYYQLDPERMYKTHYSGQWHQPMPFAMFFNWEQRGLQTGLAIHGASGVEIAQLGTRASAGCIRIAPQNAALLFNLIRAQYKGLAPRFAYDRRTASMSNDGVMMHDASGNLQLADGYKVLVFVENYGGENVVAALF